MNLLAKTILFLIVLLIVFNTSGFLKSGILKFFPPRAEAVWWATLFQQLADYALKAWEWLKTIYQKSLRDIIVKLIIDHIVDETIKWINGGGDPKFISDWQGFISDAGKIAEDSFIKEMGLAPLCRPFSAQVRISLLPVKKFSKRIECTLDDIVQNIDNFYADFSQGGWIAYNEMWEPQNNFFGATLMASMEKADRIEAEVNAKAAEAASGGGFLSARTCEGGTYQYKEVCESAESASCVSVYSDGEQKWCSSKKSKINTPGSTIGAAVAKGVTSDIEWAANIESWLSMIINAAINRLIKEGISSLNNSNNADYSGDSYYPPEYSGARDSEIGANNRQMIDEINKIANGWRQLLSFKQASLNSANSTYAVYLELQQRGCSVSQNEIDGAQGEVNRLTAEVVVLSSKITEADSVIVQIIQGGTGGQTAYFNFINKYNNNATQLEIDSDNINAASNEMNQKITEENNAQTRLNSCVPLNTAPTTPQ